MKHSTRIVMLGCLLTGLAPVSSWAQDAEQQAPAAPVMVETAQRDTFSATLWVSGTVISQNDARIAAETDGRITWVANVGSKIKKGEAIARIDAQDLQLDLADSVAQLESLKAQLKFRDSSLQRFQKLMASNNAAATQLDEAQSQLDITRQEIKRAEVAIAQIKRRIDQTEVLAPFPGVVAERLVQIGEFVSRGAQVARLVDTEHREIRAQAPLSIAGFIREGMQVSVEHNDLVQRVSDRLEEGGPIQIHDDGIGNLQKRTLTLFRPAQLFSAFFDQRFQVLGVSLQLMLETKVLV